MTAARGLNTCLHLHKVGICCYLVILADTSKEKQQPVLVDPSIADLREKSLHSVLR